MKERTLLIYFLFAGLVFSQFSGGNSRQEFVSSVPFYLQTQAQYDSASSKIILLYKAPYSNILFVKDKTGYSGGFSLQIEYKKDGKFYLRDNKKVKIRVADYEDTKNSKKYIEGIVVNEVKTGNYTIISTISMSNTLAAYKLKPLKAAVAPVDKFWGIASNDKNTIEVKNFSGAAPYSKKLYDLFITVPADFNNNLHYKLFNGNRRIDSGTAEFFASGKYAYSQKRGIRFVKSGSGSDVKIFRIPAANKKIFTGDLRIEFDEDTKIKNFIMPVKWLGGPKSFADPEYAIGLLNVFEKEETVKNLLAGPEDNYYAVLFDYWKKYDRDTSTSYNEVMYEFYSRADYSAAEFGSVDKPNGAATDRGKIYMLYGKPDSIRRAYTEENYSVEIWKYGNVKKEFLFIDKTGLGDYKLKS